MDVALLIPIIVAALAPIGAYLVATRKMSGKVTTSESSELWAESKAMREDYREQLGKAADRTRDLEERVSNLEKMNNELAGTNLELKSRIIELEQLVATLRTTIETLEGTIVRLEGQIVQKDDELEEAGADA